MRLTNREKAIIWIVAPVSLVAGMWFALAAMPAEALAVPTVENHRGVESVAYWPVPPIVGFVTVTAPLAGAWFAYAITRSDGEDEDGECESDSEIRGIVEELHANTDLGTREITMCIPRDVQWTRDVIEDGEDR